MIRFDLTPERLLRYNVGPLGPHIEGYTALLTEQGYCFQISRRKIGLVAKLSQWLQRRRIHLKQLKERHVQAFLQERWKRFSFRDGDQLTMRALLQHLRQSHAIPLPASAPPTPADLLMEDYAKFMIQERGMVQVSVRHRLHAVRRFISYCFPYGNIQLNKLRAKDITDFVLEDTPDRGRSNAQHVTTVLRSFLTFVFRQGRTTTNLAAAVPTIAGWRLSQLPRFLEAKKVEEVLQSCDRRTKVGKRDYAILLLLARLGLRSGEVVKMDLEDIDWRAGELLIHGKDGRMDKLPLPQDVGQALAAYLCKARPDSSSRRVFIRRFAPYVGFSDTGTVGGIVRNAMIRAQILSGHRGAHVLRHSLATRMLGHGASLAQIGQVLRHQYVGSTEIYAKVHLNALRQLALPWPGGAL